MIAPYSLSQIALCWKPTPWTDLWMRQPQDVSAWQEYGGRRRRDMSQQRLSARGDGWKTPNIRSSTSEELRAPRTWCGRNSLCTSRTVMTTLPIKKTCSALVHLKSHCSESTQLDIRKVPFFKYLEKKVKQFSLSLPSERSIPAYLLEE